MAEPDPAPHFELGLSLAGGVSCGAYTAGVMDFIIEALDAWQERLKQGDPEAPDHQVRLSTLGGASSGALNAAIVTAVLAHQLPAVRSSTPASEAASNPLYDSWVNMTGLQDLLGSGDGRAGRPRSLLDPTPVERAARKAIGHDLPVRDEPRRWLAEPLRLLMSVADLQGLSYPGSADGRPAPFVTDHAAMLRFAVSGVGSAASHPARGDEQAIDLRPDAAEPDKRWDTWGKDLAAAALASSSVPLALPARRLQRPWSQFAGRQLPLPGCRDAPPRAVVIEPVHPKEDGDVRTFDGVDGGLIDNTALAAVRAELNGRDVLACNARTADAVRRAVLLVDPLLGTGPAPSAPTQHPDSLAAQLAGLVRLWGEQARVNRADLALALDETVYSRFLISPGRTMVNQGGCADLAGAWLGGLGGYLSRDFRRHDFLLGRRNAQQALATHLTLPAHHPLFSRWTEPQRRRHAVGPQGELPIVPVLGPLHPAHAGEEKFADWPILAVDPSSFGRAIDSRLQTLYSALLPVAVRWLAYLPWRLLLRPLLRRALVRALGQGLREHRLQ